MEFERLLSLLGGAAAARQTFIDAFHAGADAARNGPNPANSHFAWFSSRESSKEWDRGHASVQSAQRTGTKAG